MRWRFDPMAVGAGSTKLQQGRLDSIARETRAALDAAVTKMEREVDVCGWVLERKYVYVYGIVDYAADGADSMINMFDCAWPV